MGVGVALRLGLAGLWLGLAAVVLARDRLAVPLPARLNGRDGVLVAAAAAALGVLNLARAYGSFRRPAARPARDPLARRGRRDVPDEYHPEFDFGPSPGDRGPAGP